MADDYKTISVIGDSIAQGYFDQGHVGWVGRLLTKLQNSQPYGWYVRNFAVSGDQTVDCLFRLRVNVASNPGDVLIVACGVNDLIRYQNPDSAPQVGPDVCAYRWRQLLTEAKRLGGQIVVVGMIPVDEDKQTTESSQAETGFLYNFNSDIQAYNAQIKSLCDRFGVPFVPLFDGMVAAGHAAMLHDSSHPNEIGHEWMAQQLFDFFQKQGF